MVTMKTTVVSRHKGTDLVTLHDDAWQALSALRFWNKARAGGSPTVRGAQTVTGYNDRGELLCAFIKELE